MDRSLMLHAWGITAAHRLAPIGSNWDLDELLVQAGNLLMTVRTGRAER